MFISLQFDVWFSSCFTKMKFIFSSIISNRNMNNWKQTIKSVFTTNYVWCFLLFIVAQMGFKLYIQRFFKLFFQNQLWKYVFLFLYFERCSNIFKLRFSRVHHETIIQNFCKLNNGRKMLQLQNLLQSFEKSLLNYNSWRNGKKWNKTLVIYLHFRHGFLTWICNDVSSAYAFLNNSDKNIYFFLLQA